MRVSSDLKGYILLRKVVKLGLDDLLFAYGSFTQCIDDNKDSILTYISSFPLCSGFLNLFMDISVDHSKFIVSIVTILCVNIVLVIW